MTSKRPIVTPKHILVLGAGSFGTACAAMFARGNSRNKVVIYDHKQSRVDSINQHHTNPDYLSTFELPHNLTATTSAEEAFIEDLDFIFHAIPVQVSLDYLIKIQPHVDYIVAAKQARYIKAVAALAKSKEAGTAPTTSAAPAPTVKTTKITAGPLEFDIPDVSSFPEPEITDPLDLQFIKPLVVISMSKGIHQQRLECMHEIFDSVFGLKQLHPPTPTQHKPTMRWDQTLVPDHVERASSVTHLDILTDVDNNPHPSIRFSPFSPDGGCGPLLEEPTDQGPELVPSQPPVATVTATATSAATSAAAAAATLCATRDPLAPHPVSHQSSVVDTPQFLYTCYLSGPSFAKEIMMREPTGFTVASGNLAVATLVGQTISQDFTTLCSTTTDIWGVEIAGALKNVFSIGAGLIDKFQFNTKALFITRACSEMKRIALLLYKDRVDRATFSTLAGMGDLLLSCLGPSRNRKVGMALAEGKTLKEITATSEELAEGVPTTAAIYSLLSQRNLIKFCPILLCVYRVLYEDLPVKEALVFLLSLPVTEESF